MSLNYPGVSNRLISGQVGLLPSDTIYGLSCRASDQKAVERLYKLKGRDYDKPFIILLADERQAAEVGIDPKALEPATKYWPAPLTVIVPAPKAPEWLIRSQATLAVRVPANVQLRELIKQTGPLISTSANPQGKPPASNTREAKAYFGDDIDFYIDAGELAGEPSTIVEIKSGKLKVLRQGSYRLNT